ncbi:hypothetical protein PTNB29_01580 [Pyrenophora teres f. teres]|nr:hypothetical protein PTNB29_01580 [Pyrenophora teres f. teres]
MANKFMKMLERTNMSQRSGRTIEDLIHSDDQLSGWDAMELRGWSQQNPTVPSRDLTDPLGQAFVSAFKKEFDAPKNYIETMIRALGGTEEARKTVRDDVYAKRWGPTKTPVYNLLLPALHMLPNNKEEILDITRYLVNDLKVPVEGKDALGCTALFWAISTKPYVQPEFAQILFDAGASVNTRSRFYNTVAAEISQADVHGDSSKNVQMMKWYIEHGGDVVTKDSDGMNPKTIVEMMRAKVPGMYDVIKAGKGPRKEGECANCGRTPAGSLCGQCKKAKYCSALCQTADWKMGHKKACKLA